jgi:hypothetical protein
VANGDPDSIASGVGDALRKYFAAKTPATAARTMPATALDCGPRKTGLVTP